jgi:hypothetical protein
MYLGCTWRIPALYLTRICYRIDPAHDRIDRAGDSPQGSARIQHGVRKRRETTGTNRVIRA